MTTNTPVHNLEDKTIKDKSQHSAKTVFCKMCLTSQVEMFSTVETSDLKTVQQNATKQMVLHFLLQKDTWKVKYDRPNIQEGQPQI